MTKTEFRTIFSKLDHKNNYSVVLVQNQKNVIFFKTEWPKENFKWLKEHQTNTFEYEFSAVLLKIKREDNIRTSRFHWLLRLQLQLLHLRLFYVKMDHKIDGSASISDRKIAICVHMVQFKFSICMPILFFFHILFFFFVFCHFLGWHNHRHTVKSDEAWLQALPHANVIEIKSEKSYKTKIKQINFHFRLFGWYFLIKAFEMRHWSACTSLRYAKMYIDHNSLAVGLYQYIAMEQYRLFNSQPEGDESEKKMPFSEPDRYTRRYIANKWIKMAIEKKTLAWNRGECVKNITYKWNMHIWFVVVVISLFVCGYLFFAFLCSVCITSVGCIIVV